MYHASRLSFLLFLFLSFSSLAQNNFVPGYIILPGGDTVRGEVDFRDWERTPAEITFRDSSGEITNCRPESIRELGKENDLIFRSKRVSIDLTPYTLEALTESPGIRIIPDTLLFLQLTAEGEANLYYLIDQNAKEHFWIEKPADSLYELRLERSLITQASQSGIQYASRHLAGNPVFRYMLMGVMNDRPDLTEQIEQTDLTRKDLTRLVERYNKTFDTPERIFADSKRKVRVEFGIIGGAGIQWFNCDGPVQGYTPPLYLNEIPFDPSVTWMAGASLSILFPFLHGALSVYNDLSYKPYKAEGLYSIGGITYPRVESVRYSFDMAYLKLSTLIRYKYPKGSFRPFAGIGISNSYALKAETSQVIREINSGGVVKETESPILEDPRKYEIGFVANGGISYRWFGLELRFETGNGMSKIQPIATEESSLLLLVSVTF